MSISQVTARNYDGFIALSDPIVIYPSDYLGPDFTTVVWKPFEVESTVNCSHSIEAFAPWLCSGCSKTICVIAYHALKYTTSVKDCKKFDARKILRVPLNLSLKY